MEDLDDLGGKPILDDGGCVNRGIVPIEKPTLLNQHPLLPQMPHEDVQDLHNVRGIDSGAPGSNVRVDEALAIEEGK